VSKNIDGVEKFIEAKQNKGCEESKADARRETRDAWAIYKQFQRQKPAHPNNYYNLQPQQYITHLPTPPSIPSHIFLSLS